MDRLKVLHTGGSDGQLYLRESLNKWFKLLGRMVKEFLLFSICVCQSNTSLTLFDMRAGNATEDSNSAISCYIMN